MSEETLEQLLVRKKLCETSLVLLDSVSDDDERKPGAIEYYKEQLTHIEKCIEAVNEGKPPPTVIQLKTAVIDMRAPKIK